MTSDLALGEGEHLPSPWHEVHLAQPGKLRQSGDVGPVTR